jgi:hypothetical protein
MVEAQAAARVDRLDQTKDIVIYRYIVKESIEEVPLLHPNVRFIPALLMALNRISKNLRGTSSRMQSFLTPAWLQAMTQMRMTVFW